jgi:hypothetical protein
VVVDWSAAWCPPQPAPPSRLRCYTGAAVADRRLSGCRCAAGAPCRAIAPVFDALSLQDDNASVTFIRADVEQLPDASAEADVQSIPTFHFIRGNKLVAQVVGADEQRLRDTIAKHR